MDFDVAYYEYYDCEVYDHISYISESGKEEECVYYLYIPKEADIDDTTPVVAYITHGGGVAEEERANTLHWAAGQDTEAIIVVPYTDRPDAVCASIEDACVRLNGKGNFDAISGHGTSSGGRAIIRAALKSTDKDADYSFRFANVIAYDPAQESEIINITGQTEALRALAQQGTIWFIQTDTGHNGGSGDYCRRYAQAFSVLGGTVITAEMDSASHEEKFIKPLTHNSINWAIGRGPLREDDTYENAWYVYLDGIKFDASLAEATELLQSSFNSEKPDEQGAA